MLPDQKLLAIQLPQLDPGPSADVTYLFIGRLTADDSSAKGQVHPL